MEVRQRPVSLPSPKNNRKGTRTRPFRVLVLGQPGVGKTALTVRFITKRFIYDYDSTLERKYTHREKADTENGSENVFFEILDTACHDPQTDSGRLEEQIKWADAFLLVFSITDRCSFDELIRLRFLVRHSKKTRRVTTGGLNYLDEPPTFLVGNKSDLEHERLVTIADARQRRDELSCTGFYDISVKESMSDPKKVFMDLFRQYKQSGNMRKLLISQEAITHSPPTYRRRRDAYRPSIIGTASQIPRSDTFPQTTNNLSPDISSSTIKRKRSVSRRIIGKVIPSFISRELSNDADENKSN